MTLYSYNREYKLHHRSKAMYIRITRIRMQKRSAPYIATKQAGHNSQI